MSDYLTDVAVMWGLSDYGMGMLISIAVALAISVFISYQLKKSHNKDFEHIGVISFLLILFMFTFFGMFNWIVFILILLLAVGYEWGVKNG